MQIEKIHSPFSGRLNTNVGSMLYLYLGTTSVSAAKVRLALSEKELPWDGEILNLQHGDQHRSDYKKLNPNAVVPTLVHDGKVVIESTLIIEYLDDAFPTVPLMPGDPYQKAVARLWMKKIDDHLHPACSTVSYAIAFRESLLKRPKEEVEARFSAMPDPVCRERQRLAVEKGVEAPHVPPALRHFDTYFGEMEKALSQSRYLAGDSYSLADVAVMPYVVRAELLAMDVLWADRPRVADWFKRARARPNFEPGINQYLTPTELARFEIPREATWAKIRSVLGR
jgi:glutathione S-transferase